MIVVSDTSPLIDLNLVGAIEALLNVRTVCMSPMGFKNSRPPEILDSNRSAGRLAELLCGWK